MQYFFVTKLNLHCNIPISFLIACIGGNIILPTIQGKIQLKIPPETQTGKIFKIKEKGIKDLKSTAKGDLFCKIIVETPINLQVNQIKILTSFFQSLSYNDYHNIPKYKTWFCEFKKFFTKM